MSKGYKGQVFIPSKTVEDVEAEREAQAPFDDPQAVSIDVYFAQRGIRHVVQQDMMRAFTKVKRATLEAWDTIFEKF